MDKIFLLDLILDRVFFSQEVADRQEKVLNVKDKIFSGS